MVKGPSQDVVATEVPLSKSENVSIEEKPASPDSASSSSDSGLKPVPLSFKIASILLVSMIGFGGNWSSGITGAMKTKLKKVLSKLSIVPLRIIY